MKFYARMVLLPYIIETCRNLQLKCTKFMISHPLMKTVFPERSDFCSGLKGRRPLCPPPPPPRLRGAPSLPERSMSYNLRNNIPFQSANVSTFVYGTETLSFRSPKTSAPSPSPLVPLQ